MEINEELKSKLLLIAGEMTQIQYDLDYLIEYLENMIGHIGSVVVAVHNLANGDPSDFVELYEGKIAK